MSRTRSNIVRKRCIKYSHTQKMEPLKHVLTTILIAVLTIRLGKANQKFLIEHLARHL